MLIKIYTIGLFFLILCNINLGANDKIEKDKESIKKMCGCYEVEFKYAETFTPDVNYELRDNYDAKGLEWVTTIQEDDNSVSLQHILIVENDRIIKHWRQDWIYENTDFYIYDADNTWKYVSKNKDEVKGQWTQKVYQVDDGPRYEGTGTWFYENDKAFWESNTYAPLPRRERTKRSDYNLVLRRNRHEIIPTGWVHEQDNDKIIKTGSKKKLLVQEKGMNTYIKVDESKCAKAIEWWNENNKKWKIVRDEWQKIFDQKAKLEIIPKVDDKFLSSTLDETSVNPKEIKNAIQKHVK
jgi:hypothetical protein